MASDLRKGGIKIILDRWDNFEVGSSIARFISTGITESDIVIVVGTPLYLKKYNNEISEAGSVLAAEMELISKRLLGSEEQKKTVLPLLIDGEEHTSLPPLLQGRIYADFRKKEFYLITLFDLALNLYKIPIDSQAVADLRDSLHPDR